jgi:hypothetical protein
MTEVEKALRARYTRGQRAAAEQIAKPSSIVAASVLNVTAPDVTKQVAVPVDAPPASVASVRFTSTQAFSAPVTVPKSDAEGANKP